MAGGEGFGGVEAEVGLDQALAAEDFEDAGDAAVEAVGGVEEGGVHIGYGRGGGEPAGVERRGMGGDGEFVLEAHGGMGPHAPVAEKAADDAAGDGAAVMREREGGEQVGDDGVVVAGVEGDVVAADFGDGADDVDGLVAVEGGDLDSNDLGDGGETTPEGGAEYAAADGGLEVKPDERAHGGNGAAVVDERVFGRVAPSGEAEEDGVITEAGGGGGLGDGLGRAAAGAGDLDEVAGGGGEGGVDGIRGELEHGFEETVAGIADGELRGVHAHGETARAGGNVVASERGLMARGKAAGGVKRERLRGNDVAGEEVAAEVHGEMTND